MVKAEDPNFLKYSFPIVEISDKKVTEYNEKDIRGSAFIFKHNNRSFIISNHHVIKEKITGFLVNSKTGLITLIDNVDLVDWQMSWKSHDTCDLCVMEVKIPKEIYNKIDISILERFELNPNLMTECLTAGFPRAFTSANENREPTVSPVGVKGEIINNNTKGCPKTKGKKGCDSIKLYSEISRIKGISGGPILSKINGEITLIGIVCTETYFEVNGIKYYTKEVFGLKIYILKNFLNSTFKS